ncbi:MAG: hypothetical protein Q7R98_00375 [Candidatus Jorgensenbacteria bacterium]|nr:hypothetical protein [Candidatus Jorgensenbacteria bacterium]
MKALSLFAFFIALFVMVFFVPAARADFDVFVDAGGKFIVTPIVGFGHGDTLYFVDGVADVKAYTPDSGGVFYAVGEKFVEQLKAAGYAIFGKKSAGVVPSIGNVYFVVAYTHQGVRTAGVFPVEFSPFSIGLRSYNGRVYHGGTIYFSVEAANDLERSENLW